MFLTYRTELILIKIKNKIMIEHTFESDMKRKKYNKYDD